MWFLRGSGSGRRPRHGRVLGRRPSRRLDRRLEAAEAAVVADRVWADEARARLLEIARNGPGWNAPTQRLTPLLTLGQEVRGCAVPEPGPGPGPELRPQVPVQRVQRGQRGHW